MRTLEEIESEIISEKCKDAEEKAKKIIQEIDNSIKHDEDKIKTAEESIETSKKEKEKLRKALEDNDYDEVNKMFDCLMNYGPYYLSGSWSPSKWSKYNSCNKNPKNVCEKYWVELDCN